MTFCDSAIKAFTAELADVETTLNFIRDAMRARPSIGPLMSTQCWQQLDGHNKATLTTYYRSNLFSSDIAFRGLHVTIAASFERFTRAVISEAVTTVSSKSKSHAELPDGLRKRNLKWSGRYLSRIFDPPEDVSLNYDDICRNLGSCVGSSTTFVLNAAAFSIGLPILSADGLNQALERIDADKGIWDAMGKHAKIQAALNEKKPRDAANSLREFLKTFSRSRNRIVHGAEVRVPVDVQDVQNALQVYRALAEALPTAIATTLKVK